MIVEVKGTLMAPAYAVQNRVEISTAPARFGERSLNSMVES